MLKFLGAILVIFSSFAIGTYGAERKKRCLSSLRELRGFFINLQGEIRYGGTPLKEAIELSAGGQKKEHLTPLQTVFLELAEQMEEKSSGSFFELWKESLKKGAQAAAIGGKDLEKLFRVGESLGYLDRETQLNCLECYLEEINLDISVQEKEMKEKVRLYQWLGALAGIFICIVMI